jgi:hypothetical protein
MASIRRYRCRYCGLVLNGWLPAARPYLTRMERECIDAVVVEAYEVIEEDTGCI